jgi:hypothetical protein
MAVFSAVVSFLSCPGCLIFAALCWQSCSVDTVLAVLVLVAVLPVPFWLSRSSCPVLAALRAFPFLAVFFFLFCPSRLVIAVLCWQPYPGSPILAALSWQHCPGSSVLVHVLEVLSWKSCFACPILAVLF